MRLEVQIGESAPTIYLIENQDVYIGARDTNDIIIKSSEISGKHVKLSFRDKTCFITDMGSTNGTYLNDEQLIPGRSVEFPIEDVVMLGHQVSLRVLPKAGTIKPADLALDGPAAPSPEVLKPKVVVNTSTLDIGDRTRVISLKEMQKAQKARDEKKREKVKEKKRQESKRIRAEKESFKRVTVIAGTWIALGIVGHFAWKSFSISSGRTYSTSKVTLDRVMLDASLEDKEAIIINPEELQTLEVLDEFFKKTKCRTSLETAFCSRMDHTMLNSGVIMMNGDLAFYVQENRWMAEARSFIKNHTNPDLKPEERTADDETLKKLAVILFMHKSLGKSLPQNFKPRNFYFVFYSLDKSISHYSVFKTELLPSFSLKAEREWAKLDKQNGFALIESLYSLIGHRSF